MVSVSVQGLYLAFWCQNNLHLVYYLYNKRVITPWQCYIKVSNESLIVVQFIPFWHTLFGVIDKNRNVKAI